MMAKSGVRVDGACEAGTNRHRRHRTTGTKIRAVPRVSLVAIVDDDESVRLATESLVKSLGHRAAAFDSAEAFLGSAAFDNAACVITDVKMPGMTGVQLQEVMLTQGKRLPVIFMTAYPEAHVRDQAMAAGACGFLSKPFDSADMITCLAAALQGDSPTKG
jgi:FixJ family two-component response regulator